VAGNSELQPELQLRAWPSPTSDFLTIAIKPYTSYSIYDIAGKLMVTRTATDYNERLDIRSWPAGQYCITSNNAKTVRFIKQ
jgi:hypothetical protein